ncbi:Response regulator receiver domain-containing protein [Paracidovorax valerianellae]|uniref:Response regulator receiver domain-containing protein n=1 Tax=Paracidovorax valerianellae TaxID=187868 RepID=A0A1G6SYS2_9BURK|nr:response regulator [Paracidovorax valerianellae]SDD21861.1 Response regulator receiver domain-containing protein [Paracidovorax valerianellae]
MPTPDPIVLLVEDDASVSRFVGMVLDGLPVSLHVCASVEEALEFLAQQRAQLIITDLMMPGESGMGLIQRMAADPALAAGAKVVVFSAGLNTAVRAQLASMNIWRTLAKPASVGDLQGCVRDALELLRPAEAAAPAVLEASAMRGVAEGLADHEGQALAKHFANNRPLFDTYRDRCVVQFAKDCDEGDRAVGASDLAALRRLGHNLRTVLLTLGRSEGSRLAGVMEEAALAEDGSAAIAGWKALREHLASR